MKIFKTILLTSLLFVSSAQASFQTMMTDDEVHEIICGEKYQIADHMREMGFIIRNLSEMVTNVIQGNDEEHIRAEVMKDARLLRVHLSAVFPMTPEKIKSIDPLNLQRAKLIFQKYLLTMMSKTVELEEELLIKPTDAISIQAQRVKIAGIIIKIKETVDEAHALFKDKVDDEIENMLKNK